MILCIDYHKVYLALALALDQTPAPVPLMEYIFL